jgi:hypothetical protein
VKVKESMRNMGLFLALLAMGSFSLYGAGTHFNETLPDPSANASVKPGAVPVTNGYDYGLTTDSNSLVPVVFSNSVALGQTTTQASGGGLVGTSTATAAGNNSGIFTPITLAAGSASTSIGSVVCATSSASGLANVFLCPATSNLYYPVGIAANAVSSGSIVNVYTSGFVQALTTGTVNAGDLETTSSLSAGYLASNNTFTFSTYTVVGIAMTAGNSNGGLTLIRLK